MNLTDLKESSRFQKTLKYIKDNKWLLLIVILLGLFVYTFRKPIENNSPLGIPQESLNVPLTTSVTTAPRTSPTDSNVEVEQHYTAKINGQTITIPVVTSPQENPNGVKGIIKQEVDMTPVVDKAVKDGVAKAKVNWEVSTGLGVHEGDLYIPVEAQRNYKKDKAIAIEIHLDPSKDLKVTGGELKHVWMF